MSSTLPVRTPGGRLRRVRWAAAVLAAGIAAAAVLVAPAPAFADDYPTWDQVQAARSNEAAKKAEVDRINQLLAQLSADASAKSADAQAKSEAYFTADTAYQAANQKVLTLQKQADDARAAAAASKRQAGQLAAQIYRGGGTTLAAGLLANGSGASDALTKLGRAGKLSEQANEIYARALRDGNTAQSLTDQADVAKGIREKAKDDAQAAYTSALQAAQAAQQALDAQQQHSAELQAQLTLLTQNREDAEAKYQEYLKAQGAAGATIGSNRISASGWTWPTSGHISGPFGYRIHPVTRRPDFHYGVDIAGGCNVPIYAAHAGTVGFIGYGRGYGNYLRIDHGGGISTQYAHIVNGGVKVKLGQNVVAGQLIALTGATGDATGCHLHYEVRLNGAVTDPVPFMRNQGVDVG